AVEPARRDAPPAEGRWPLVVASHCTGCTRFDLMTVAERLASHGVVVAAPDHAGDTLQDDLAGTSLPLDTETLALRRDDLKAVLDAALDGAWVDGLTFDADRVGALGHSFGSVTAGLLAQGDPRIRAVMGIAAPMENPLLPGVEVATLTTPLLLLVAQEDHSIFEIGNELIRDNWASAGGPAWKVELPDAGHWSVSDLCGLTAGFMPCCGDAERQVGGAPFTYGDPAALRDRTATVAAAFFLDRFEIAPGALDDLGAESR
ncbi:MAG TPA: dienelactone hydrolase family protein, partial [Myxococcota bacterium]|nr:dienelactone hydrolase family protein [Myxococcota bacterium]